jgi:hypothetical protein
MQEQRGRPHGPLPLYSGQRLHRGRLDRGLCDTPCFRIFRQLFQATAGLEDTNAKMGWDEIKKHVEAWSMHSEAIFLVGLVYRVDCRIHRTQRVLRYPLQDVPWLLELYDRLSLRYWCLSEGPHWHPK